MHAFFRTYICNLLLAILCNLWWYSPSAVTMKAFHRGFLSLPFPDWKKVLPRKWFLSRACRVGVLAVSGFLSRRKSNVFAGPLEALAKGGDSGKGCGQRPERHGRLYKEIWYFVIGFYFCSVLPFSKDFHRIPFGWPRS